MELKNNHEEQAAKLKKLAESNLLDIYRRFKVQGRGLQTAEAKRRLFRFGYNILPSFKTTSPLKKLLEQFKNLFNILLVIAAILSIISGLIYSDQNSLNMGYVIFGCVFFSIFLGLFQEYRAEKAVRELRILIPSNVKVIRNSTLLRVKSIDLVPGDILIIEAGDKVPADIRLIDSHILSIDSSILTGESEPQIKDALNVINQMEKDVINFDNLVLAGTSVISGKGKGIVLATGKYTQIARVVEIIDETEI